jgi:PIN domain nuclease of toxin-antitoxin system
MTGPLVDPENVVVVSAVSAMEIAIKQSLGKIELPGPAESWLEPAVRAAGFDLLPIEFEDGLRLRALPWLHRDPFDRLLVAQAMGGWTLCTVDQQLAAYDCEVWGV